MPADQLVAAALDYFGLSPQARARERALQEDYYNSARQALESGYTLKERGFDPKVVEASLGPEYSALLLGAEKTDAFKQAAQSRQTRDFLRQSVEGFLTAPETQTIEGITPEEAEGFFPRLRGPNIGGPESIATAALTRPNVQQIGERFASLPAGLQALYAGPTIAAQETARQGLERVQVPGVGLEERRTQVSEAQVPIAQSELGLAREQLSFERGKEDRRGREQRRTDFLKAQRTLAITHPQLTPAQSRRVARVYAEQAPERTLRELADVPGVIKSAAGGALKRSQTFQRVNASFDRIPTFVRNAQGKKQAGQFNEETLAGENDAALREAVQALREDFTVAGLPPEAIPQAIAQEISERATFAVKRGSRLVAVPFSALTPDEQTAKLRIIEQALAQGVGGGGGRVDEYLRRATGQSGGAPAEQPTIPFTGPMTERGAVPAPTPGVTAPQGGGIIFEPPIPVPPPPGIPSQERRRGR